MDATLHFEDWGASYGSPYLIDDEAAAEGRAIAEKVPSRAGGGGIVLPQLRANVAKWGAGSPPWRGACPLYAP